MVYCVLQSSMKGSGILNFSEESSDPKGELFYVHPSHKRSNIHNNTRFYNTLTLASLLIYHPDGWILREENIEN